MNRARRPLTAGAAALALAVALSGCSLFADTTEAQTVPTVGVPVEMPVTFADEARWTVELGTDTQPANAPEGIAVILPGRTSSSLYRVALLAPDNGSIRWVSDDFENPTPDVVPKVSVSTVGGTSWVIVRTQVSANQVQLDAYPPEGTGDRRAPETSTTITGADDETVPSVSVGAEGIVASPAGRGDIATWEAEVEQLVEDYEAAQVQAEEDGEAPPQKPATPPKPSTASLVINPATGEATEYEGPGVLSAAWSEGYVVTNPSDASGFGYIVGGEVAWQSSTSRPANTDRDSKGNLLASGPGILLAEWAAADGDPVLAVHEIRTGKVLAVQDELDPTAVAASHGQPLVQSDGGTWASWGQYVFGLKGGPSSEVNLHDGTVRAIYQDVLYVEDAAEPLTASAAVERAAQTPTPAPSDGGGAEPTEEAPAEPEGSGETFDGMIDATTGDPLTNEEPGVVPLFVSNASQGVFVLSTDGKTRLYSTPLS